MRKVFLKIFGPSAFAYVFFLFANHSLEASSFAFGLNGGMGFPFSHTKRMDPGFTTDAYWRVDPYEVRFNYSHYVVDYYSVLLGIKHFFSQGVVRPYAEIAAGPTVVDTPRKGLAYGLSPVGTLGAEIGINENFSTIVVTRYSGFLYFGDTQTGNWEANHGLSLLAGVTLWF